MVEVVVRTTGLSFGRRNPGTIDWALGTIDVHTTIVSGRAEQELSGDLIIAREHPLCHCPEPCACYAEGYAAGKDKAYFEVLNQSQGGMCISGVLRVGVGVVGQGAGP